MDNPETLATLGDKEWIIQRHWPHWAIKNEQSRDTGHIGLLRIDNPETLATLGYKEWTIQRHWPHWAIKNGQSRDTGHIGHKIQDEVK